MPYEPGVLRAVGTRHEGEPCEAEVRTAGAPAALRLSVDRPVITTAPGDLAHVVFEVVDAQGVVVPTADNRVTITVEGGTLLVMDNGDLRDHDPYRSDNRRAFKGRGLAAVRGDTRGRIRVTAKGRPVRAVRSSGVVLQCGFSAGAWSLLAAGELTDEQK